MSRQLEEFGLPLVAGGLADQPMGYLADVMKVRSYVRAADAVEQELRSGQNDAGEPHMPAPPWAHRLVLEVAAAMLADAEDDA